MNCKLFIACIIATRIVTAAEGQILSGWGPETAWTWISWPELTLEFPYKQVLRHNLNQDYRFLSDIGPRTISFYEEERRKHRQPASDDVLAWTLLKCSTCNFLVAATWEALREKIHKTGNMLTASHIEKTLAEACTDKVPSLLTALSVTSTIPGTSKFQPYTAQMCKRMLQTPEGFSMNPLVANTLLGLKVYVGQINAQSPGRQPAGLRREAVPGTCEDFHPKCPMWAAQGECERNPLYMTGTEPPGYCQLSCGMCLARLPDGSVPDMSTGTKIAAKIAKDVQSRASKETRVCEGIDPKLIPQATPVTIDLERLSKQGSILRNLLEGNHEISEGTREADQWAVDADIVHKLRDQIFGTGRPSLSTEQESQLSDEEFSRIQEAGAAFQPPKCFIKPAGYWTYEYCHKKHIRQVHYNAYGTAEQVILLGAWDPSQQPPQTRKQLVTLKPDTPNTLGETLQVGFYSLRMAKGDKCKADNGVTIRRDTLVRLICSTDAHTHMAVDEFPTCFYRIDIFAPEMCSAEELAKNSLRN